MPHPALVRGSFLRRRLSREVQLAGRDAKGAGADVLWRHQLTGSGVQHLLVTEDLSNDVLCCVECLESESAHVRVLCES